jgi:hypothetical protein
MIISYAHSCRAIFVGNVMPRYQVGSTKGDTSSRYIEGSRQPSTDDVRKSKPGSRYYTAFGVDLSPDNMAVAIVYFVQGVLGLARLAVSFYLKDDLHLDPAEACVAHSFLHPLYSIFMFFVVDFTVHSYSMMQYFFFLVNRHY